MSEEKKNNFALLVELSEKLKIRKQELIAVQGDLMGFPVGSLERLKLENKYEQLSDTISSLNLQIEKLQNTELAEGNEPIQIEADIKATAEPNYEASPLTSFQTLAQMNEIQNKIQSEIQKLSQEVAELKEQKDVLETKMSVQIEKTVFISYRRTDSMAARAIFQHLHPSFDVFLDVQSIDTGDFLQVIKSQILSRAHFIVIITLDAIERFSDENGVLRQEIEFAIENKRNIIPVVFECFNWDTAKDLLPDSLSILTRYNSLRIPIDYFDEAMNRLVNRYLNTGLNTVLHPVTPEEAKKAKEIIEKESKAPKVSQKQVYGRIKIYAKPGFAVPSTEDMRRLITGDKDD